MSLDRGESLCKGPGAKPELPTTSTTTTNQKSRECLRDPEEEASVPGAGGVPEEGGGDKVERKVKARPRRASYKSHVDLI